MAGLDKPHAVREWRKLRLATRLQGRAELSLGRLGSAGCPAGSGVVCASLARACLDELRRHCSNWLRRTSDQPEHTSLVMLGAACVAK